MIHLGVVVRHALGELLLNVCQALLSGAPQQFYGGCRLALALERFAQAGAQDAHQPERGIRVVAFVIVFFLVCHSLFVGLGFAFDPLLFALEIRAVLGVDFLGVGFAPGSRSLIITYFAQRFDIIFDSGFEKALVCAEFIRRFNYFAFRTCLFVTLNHPLRLVEARILFIYSLELAFVIFRVSQKVYLNILIQSLSIFQKVLNNFSYFIYVNIFPRLNYYTFCVLVYFRGIQTNIFIF